MFHDGADLCRSLSDSRGILIHLDLDSADPADPERVFEEPEATFRALEPVLEAVLDELRIQGVEPLVVMSGSGWHFWALVPNDTPLRRELPRIGSLGTRLERRLRREGGNGDHVVEEELAFQGVGRLLELATYRVLDRIRGRTKIPVLHADLPPPGGPFAWFDLSPFGDPLSTRFARCPFSVNQKPLAAGVASTHPFSICLPRRDRSLDDLLEARSDAGKAAAFAASEEIRIPEVSAGAVLWVADYESSPIRLTHQEVDRDGDRIAVRELPRLPPCATLPVRSPNPLLLRPECIRTLVLLLTAEGWEASAITELLTARFETDFGWGDYWARNEPETRARLWVRLLRGGLDLGIDRVEDLSCERHRERGLCPEPAEGCGFDFEGVKIALAGRGARHP